ncbi:MAG TPA: hypothetical protein VGO92_13305 [Acidimicrobiales bacterium]|nr:hypothetical protein [Acidimicrobiales bacterium]
MKRIAWPAGVLVLALLMTALPARAVTHYKILSPRAFFAATSDACVAACDPAFITSPANGVDSMVIDIHSRANTPLNVVWTANTSVSGVIGGSLSVVFYTRNCALTPSTAKAATAPGVWSMTVPAAAYWMVVTNNGFANVDLSF